MTQRKELYTQLGIICGILFVLVGFIRTSDIFHVLGEIQIETYKYPEKTNFHKAESTELIAFISKQRIRKRLEQLSGSFPDGRSYNSDDGYKSSLYLYEKLRKLVSIDKKHLSVMLFNHSGWKQPSVMFRIQGRSENLVVVGSHIDSINLNPLKKAPGVDDNLSGVDVLLETIDVLNDAGVDFSKWQNSVEFHFYSAEEMSSLGSRDVFKAYKKDNRKVVAMLQQDMTGFTKQTFETGMPEHFGLVADYSSNRLAQFVRDIIGEYTDIQSIDTKCKKVCSDQVSPLIYGYPGVYVLESVIESSNPYIHTEEDLLDNIDYNHMVQHAKLVLAFVSELSTWVPEHLSDHDLFKFSLYDFFILFTTASIRRTVWCVILIAAAISIFASLISDTFSGESTENAEPEETIPLHTSQKDDENNMNRKSK